MRIHPVHETMCPIDAAGLVALQIKLEWLGLADTSMGIFCAGTQKRPDAIRLLRIILQLKFPNFRVSLLQCTSMVRWRWKPFPLRLLPAESG